VAGAPCSLQRPGSHTRSSPPACQGQQRPLTLVLPRGIVNARGALCAVRIVRVVLGSEGGGGQPRPDGRARCGASLL